MQGLPIFVHLSDGKLTVPMTLDKSTKVNAILDTGNPSDILFSDELANKHSFNPTMLTLGPIQYMIGSWEPCCVGANYALLGFDFFGNISIQRCSIIRDGRTSDWLKKNQRLLSRNDLVADGRRPCHFWIAVCMV